MLIELVPYIKNDLVPEPVGFIHIETEISTEELSSKSIRLVPKFRPMRSVFQYCEIMGQIQ